MHKINNRANENEEPLLCLLKLILTGHKYPENLLLCENFCIITIIVSRNAVSERCSTQIADAIKVNTTLRKLHICIFISSILHK